MQLELNNLLNVNPINGRSLPLKPNCRVNGDVENCTDFTFSKSSKLEVSSFVRTVGMNGGRAVNKAAEHNPVKSRIL